MGPLDHQLRIMDLGDKDIVIEVLYPRELSFLARLKVAFSYLFGKSGIKETSFPLSDTEWERLSMAVALQDIIN